MAKYTVTAPFKDGTGRHRPGDILEDIDHAAGLIDAGLINAEPEPEPPEKKEPPAEKSEPEEENFQEEKTEDAAPAQKTEKPAPSKKAGGKKK